MRNHPAGLRPRHSLIFTAAPVVLLLASATALFAQRDSRNRPAEQRARANQVALNEWRRTHMAEEVNKQFEKRRISLLPQIKEDFTRIQVVNNAMMRKVFNNEVMDYKDVSGHLSEIRKRANRLKENLMLPEGEEKERTPKPSVVPARAPLKDSLLALDTLIMGFVQNPLFQKPGVIDAKLSTRAGQDLKTIIDFSGSIKKEVEKLSKLQTRP